MQGNAMVIDKAGCINLPNQLVVMFGMIELKAKSFHDT